MNDEQLQVRLAYLKNELAGIQTDEAYLVERLATKQLQLDAWYTREQAKLTKRKAVVARDLAATKRLQRHAKHGSPEQAKLFLHHDSATPSNVKPA